MDTSISISKAFHFLTGDMNYLDYGGKWYRKVSSTRFHIIELTNMWDATGDKTQDKYHVSLSEVDLTSPQKEQVYESCDCEADSPELQKVDALHSYGAVAPLSGWAGNNASKLLAQARKESRNLDDPAAYEAAMNRPVNKLGSTAREYAKGDFLSAVNRGIQRNNSAANIMAKMQSASVRMIKQSDISKCRFFILLPDHYRVDGSCKCNDRAERDKLINGHGYTENDFDGIPLIT